MTDARASEIALNRALWTVINERFTDAAADDMWSRLDVVWGLFAVQEKDLGVLGDVHGLDVVELACGTAYLSAWLARAGASAVAVDLSREQLASGSCHLVVFRVPVRQRAAPQRGTSSRPHPLRRALRVRPRSTRPSSPPATAAVRDDGRSSVRRAWTPTREAEQWLAARAGVVGRVGVP